MRRQIWWPVFRSGQASLSSLRRVSYGIRLSIGKCYSMCSTLLSLTKCRKTTWILARSTSYKRWQTSDRFHWSLRACLRTNSHKRLSALSTWWANYTNQSSDTMKSTTWLRVSSMVQSAPNKPCWLHWGACGSVKEPRALWSLRGTPTVFTLTSLSHL